MERVRSYQAEQTRNAVIQGRQKLLDVRWRENIRQTCPLPFLPGHLDIAEFPNVQQLLHLPSSETVSATMVDAVFPSVQQTLHAWRLSMHEALYQQIRYGIGRGVGTMSPVLNATKCLHLAICILTCTDPLRECEPIAEPCRPLGWLMWYPEFIHHNCNYAEIRIPSKVSPIPENTDLITLATCAVRGPFKAKWHTGHLKIHKLAQDVIIRILGVCGLDVRTTRVLDMDIADHRFICMICHAAAIPHACPVNVIPWRKAVRCLKFSNLSPSLTHM